ncbi:recombinase RecT [Streptomyces rimosus]|uniref:recombinase RecT n=1 Tax=Streptomyces rimosus TaxID=1927 RepID=UPI0031D78129
MSDLADRVKAKTADETPEGPAADLAVQDRTLAWLERRRTYITEALPRHVDEGHFIQTALSAMPRLRRCRPETIFSALLACARFGLAPDGRNAAIVPYGKNAVFQPMYEGLIEVMYRSGRVVSVHFDWIREHDVWDYTPTAPYPADFLHKPDPAAPKDRRGPVILAYAFCWMRGGRRSQVILLNRQDAEEIRDRHSRAYALAEQEGTRDSAWHTDFDAMWAKSCVRRLAKRVPTSPELVELLRADETAEDAVSAPPLVRTVSEADWDETDGGPAAGAPAPDAAEDVS